MPTTAEAQLGDRVRVASGDYSGHVGSYEGRDETTGAHLVHLEQDGYRDPPVHCDRVEVIA